MFSWRGGRSKRRWQWAHGLLCCVCLAAVACTQAPTCGSAINHADSPPAGSSALGVAVSVAAGDWAIADKFVHALLRRLSARSSRSDVRADCACGWVGRWLAGWVGGWVREMCGCVVCGCVGGACAHSAWLPSVLACASSAMYAAAPLTHSRARHRSSTRLYLYISTDRAAAKHDLERSWSSAPPPPSGATASMCVRVRPLTHAPEQSAGYRCVPPASPPPPAPARVLQLQPNFIQSVKPTALASCRAQGGLYT